LPLETIVQRYQGQDVELHSVQKQGQEEAHSLGVTTYDFKDFADCAALMMQMDEIVSVDTAAIHLAGAIGHPHATVLLPKWHSWRWKHNPFYPNIRIVESGR
jgi:ADP-heptose:LPS heptosyltransferase